MPKFVMTYEDDCGSYTETVTKFFDPDVEYETQDDPTWRCLLKYFVGFLEKAGYVLGDGVKEKLNDFLADMTKEQFENLRNIPRENFREKIDKSSLIKESKIAEIDELCKNLDDKVKLMKAMDFVGALLGNKSKLKNE